jgi:hypothetical protein
MELNEIDDSVFRPLLDCLNSTKQPQSQIFGLCNIRGYPADLSKRSWSNPRLHHLLMKFALMHLPHDFTFTSVQVIRDIQKFDKCNKGKSYVVRFGAFTGGELVLKTPTDIEYNIRHRPMIFSPAEIEHYFKEAKGTPFTLVFYNLTTKHPPVVKLSDYEAVFESNKWSIAWHRPGLPIVYLSKKFGIPSQIAKNKEIKKRIFKVAEVDDEVKDDARFSAAQNLMMRSAATLNT